MKRIAIVFSAALALVSCSGQMNDLAHEEVPAELTAFEVEGQLSSKLNKHDRKVVVTLPVGTDLTALTVKTITYTEGATCTPALKAGSTVSLAEPLTLTITTYDNYVWTITGTADPEKPDEPKKQDEPQLYNMGFDYWSVAKDTKINQDYNALYAEDATEEEKAVWGSAAASTKLIGTDSVVPESEFVAVSGEGKKALKLETGGIDFIITKLAAGSVFNGYAGDIDFAKMSAHIFWGTPFTARPKTLEGYYCYKPKTIDFVQAPYTDKKGQTDNGHVLVILSDWDNQFEVSPPDLLLDFDNDPGIIGYGKVVFDKEMSAYEKFSVNIEYRNERTPKWVTIVCSSSALGDYFTGAKGSVLYLDEFKFLY